MNGTDATDTATLLHKLGTPASCEAIAELATRFWDHPERLVPLIDQKAILPQKKDAIRTIGVYYYRIGIGGIENVNLYLSKLWMSMGYKVVFLVDEADDVAASDAPQGASFATLPKQPRTAQDCYLPRALALRDVIRRYNIDVIVYANWLGLCLPWDCLVSKTSGCHFVVHTHGSFSAIFAVPETPTIYIPACYALCDSVVALNAAGQEIFRAFNPNTYLTVNPPDELFAHAQAAPLDSHDVVFVARLEHAKQPEKTIESFAHTLRKVPDARLKLVGPCLDSDYLELLSQLADSLGIADSCDFCGPLDIDGVYDMFQRSSVFLSTSYTEGYCLTMQEAMLCGVPIVMFELPVLTLSACDDGVVSVSMDDVEALGDAVAELLLNRDLRLKHGAAARALVLRTLDFDFKGLWSSIFDTLTSDSWYSSAAARSFHPQDVFNGTWLDVSNLLHCSALTQKEIFDTLDKNATYFRDRSHTLERDLQAVVNSRSFKIGRAITAPLRALKGLLLKAGSKTHADADSDAGPADES